MLVSTFSLVRLACVTTLVSGVTLIACGGPTSPAGTTSGTGGGATTDLPCAIHELLADRCVSCHSSPAKYGAPMPLVTRADLAAPVFGGQGNVAELSLERMQAAKPMPPPPNERATDAEIAAFSAWIDDGMPAGAVGQSCGGGDGAGAGGGGGLPCEPALALT
ncbi:MAG: hypothetical protein EXR75_13495, partial [Myxococcales bacterium]|nr:hypothetical protein [Myxococcales bacterium]